MAACNARDRINGLLNQLSQPSLSDPECGLFALHAETDCNGATVGGLLGLTGNGIPTAWTVPWAGRIGVSPAGCSELQLDDVVSRTVAVAEDLSGEQHA
jgi:hypothetical protein